MARQSVPRSDGSIRDDRSRVLGQFHVSREIENKLDRLVELLLKWQKVTNLIGNSTVHTVWTRHVADSLQLADLAPTAQIWVDLGSGAGFPGLVIACTLKGSGSIVHLVESNQKKAAFLREAVRDLALPAEVHARRIEDFTRDFDGRVDVVTARALAPLPDLLTLAEPLLKRGAQGLFLKGQDVVDELTESSKCWKIQTESIPSRTSKSGCVLVVTKAERMQHGRSKSIRERNETGRT